MNNIEIEIQVRVEKVKNLIDFLEKEGKFIAEEYQKDEYFTPAHRNFLDAKPVDEWLRIRQSDKNSITYKNWHHDPKTGVSNFCDEYETNIKDPEQMRKIFEVLDIKSLITIEKTRKIWLYRDWEIVIDTITGLGEFVEIEYKGDKAVDPDAEATKMKEFLKNKKVGKIEINYVGYPYLILYGTEGQFREV